MEVYPRQMINKTPHTLKVLTPQILCNIQTPTKIKQIKDWEAERILGVRTGRGQDEIELTYRVEETIILAGRIKQDPLTRYDAETMYRERCQATIKYCLPITRFTKGQYYQVSKIVEQAIITQLGFNRHMSKAVLYGS